MPTWYLTVAAITFISPALCAQQEAQQLSAAGMQAFLTSYQKALDPVDAAYEDMENYKLPLLDENGQPLGRHHLSDSRKEIAGLRETVRQLEAKPQDLVLTTHLFIQTEALVDDLFDLSQIAYDNDREELGKRLADFEVTMDQRRTQIEAYVLSLAAEKQKRLDELEKQNRGLERRIESDARSPKSGKPKKGSKP